MEDSIGEIAQEEILEQIQELTRLVKQNDLVLDTFVSRLAHLENLSEKSIIHRMTYMSWMISNPISLVIFPTILSIVVEIIINNWENTLGEWSLSSLTKGTNWTIPILVSIVGLVTAFGNKLYLIIQENGDMNVLAELDNRINGINKRLEAEREKREAEREKREAERDEQIKVMLKAIEDIKLSQARIEKDVEHLQ